MLEANIMPKVERSLLHRQQDKGHFCTHHTCACASWFCYYILVTTLVTKGIRTAHTHTPEFGGHNLLCYYSGLTVLLYVKGYKEVSSG